jgi:hypothetical protein
VVSERFRYYPQPRHVDLLPSRKTVNGGRIHANHHHIFKVYSSWPWNLLEGDLPNSRKLDNLAPVWEPRSCTLGRSACWDRHGSGQHCQGGGITNSRNVSNAYYDNATHQFEYVPQFHHGLSTAFEDSRKQLAMLNAGAVCGPSGHRRQGDQTSDSQRAPHPLPKF